MENKMEKKILSILAVITSLLFATVLAKNYLIYAVTQNVIKELKRNYTPGPYDPGFDPDKVNPNALRSEFSTTELLIR